jgi:hypothetical protein
LGKKGARGTGITIRFEVEPRAREGRDFVMVGDPKEEGSYIVFKNKNALKVIPESLEMSPSQYFEFLAEGKEISTDDQALLWKLKRRLSNALASGLASPEELKKVRAIVLNQLKSNAPNRQLVFEEWLKLEGARLGRDVIQLVELIKGGYRVDPAPLVSGLKELAQGTELEAWMVSDYLPGLLQGLKKDLSVDAIQNALFSDVQSLRKFGLAALKESQARRPSAYFGALENLMREQKPGERDPGQVAKRWLARTPDKTSQERAAQERAAQEKASWISRQKHQQEWLSFVPEAERAMVSMFLKKQSNAGLFEKIAEKRGGASQKELLDHAKPESFQFVSFEIPQGGQRFEMGSPETETGRYGDELLHEVLLTESFELQATPVTEYQKAFLLGENIKYLKDDGNRAAAYISWNDAKKLAAQLTELDPDYIYRLPYEKEWEYAARAGTKTAYSFGDDAAELSDYGIHKGNNSASRGHDVATRKPNPAGLYDVHGNVWEWCEDLYSQGGSARVMRGGSWNNNPRFLRSALRDGIHPGSRVPYGGVRLLRTLRAGGGASR